MLYFFIMHRIFFCIDITCIYLHIFKCAHELFVIFRKRFKNLLLSGWLKAYLIMHSPTLDKYNLHILWCCFNYINYVWKHRNRKQAYTLDYNTLTKTEGVDYPAVIQTLQLCMWIYLKCAVQYMDCVTSHEKEK